MGIKYLNKYIRANCTNSINKIHFSELQHKKIVVDVSIYLYKYKSEGSLMEQMYLMINLFRYYNIIPVFIFDGKPPDEKRNTLEERRKSKKEAQINYDLLKEQYEISTDDAERSELSARMDNEKKKTVKISHTDIMRVKELMDALGVTYKEAPGEADQLCAYLLHKKMVYGCMSEDMDMFVYGCHRVFRYVSLFNSTCVYYNLPGILNDLQLSLDQFKMVTIISGTDYNTDSGNDMNVYEVMNQFGKYKKLDSPISFVDWLYKNNKLNSNDSIEAILNMFDVYTFYINEPFDKLVIKNSNIIKSDVEFVMKQNNFIFV